MAILKTYKVNENKKDGYVLTSNTTNASFEVLPYQADPKVEKKNGFFSKIRSVFKK